MSFRVIRDDGYWHLFWNGLDGFQYHSTHKSLKQLFVEIDQRLQTYGKMTDLAEIRNRTK